MCVEVELLSSLFRYTDIFIYVLDNESQISYCWKKKGKAGMNLVVIESEDIYLYTYLYIQIHTQ